MVTYDWEKIFRFYEYDRIALLSAFVDKLQIKPKPYYYIQNREKYWKAGDSFLVNAEGILSCSKTYTDIFMYIYLASKRSIFDYKVRGITFLDRLILSDTDKAFTDRTDLITTVENRLYFLYEQD